MLALFVQGVRMIRVSLAMLALTLALPYPTITFKSTNLNFDGDRVVSVDGELTLLGVTKPVTLAVANESCAEHPFNKRPMCGAEASATVKRSEWGMKYGIPKAVADDVHLIIPIEAYRS
jgi:polyisoprenoid-binding protein YceI